MVTRAMTDHWGPTDEGSLHEGELPGGEPGPGGAQDPSPSVVIACGALARELLHLIEVQGQGHLTVECLPAQLHNRPERIPDRLRDRIRRAKAAGRNVFVAYADCGTAGGIDAVCAEENVPRIPGAHCYEFFAGSEQFAGLMDEEPGTYFLTDFLTRHFDTLVIQGLGLDRHPELLPIYFGNYRRLVYLAQTDDPVLDDKARAAAGRLELEFERRFVGYGGLAAFMTQASGPG